MFGYEPEYIDCGDARIACYDIGRGHPLILLHGNGEDSSYWNAQISEFTRFMRVIAVDSRGHGASDPLSSPSFPCGRLDLPLPGKTSQ